MVPPSAPLLTLISARKNFSGFVDEVWDYALGPALLVLRLFLAGADDSVELCAWEPGAASSEGLPRPSLVRRYSALHYGMSEESSTGSDRILDAELTLRKPLGARTCFMASIS